MARRMGSAFSGEKPMVWSNVKVVATGRIVDAGIFCGFFWCGGGGGFLCFNRGFCKSRWQEVVFLWSSGGEKCGKAGLLICLCRVGKNWHFFEIFLKVFYLGSWVDVGEWIALSRDCPTDAIRPHE